MKISQFKKYVTPLGIAMAAAQLLGRLGSGRAGKRREEMSLLSAEIDKAVGQSNILKSATEGYGLSTVASSHAGGFAPNVFSGSWSNVAADWRAAQNHYDSVLGQVQSDSSANRTKQLFSAVNSLLSLWNGRRMARANQKIFPNAAASLLDLD
ncbi:MAG: hypothetical protein LBT98_03430 [Puniceicoccales bacterium]|nr:hypothetical protein [Puniceicoccales bacterium]